MEKRKPASKFKFVPLKDWFYTTHDCCIKHLVLSYMHFHIHNGQVVWYTVYFHDVKSNYRSVLKYWQINNSLRLISEC